MKSRLRLVVAVVLVGLFLAYPVGARTITAWIFGWSQPEQKGIDEAIALFEEQNPDIEVDKSVYGGDIVNKLSVAVAGGAPPDLVLLSGVNYATLVRNGAVMPIGSYFAKSKLWDKLIPQLREIATFEGEEYGVPGIAVYPLDGFVWNKRLFEEAGLSPLSHDRVLSWQDLAGMNRKLVRRDGDGTLVQVGYLPYEGRNGNLDVVETYFGLQAFEGAKTMLDTPGFVDALAFLNEHFVLSVGAQEVLGLVGQGSWYAIGRGATAMANLGGYAPEALAQRAPDEEFGVTWHPNPTGNKRQQIVSFVNVIPRGAKNPDDAWRLAEFFATSYEAMQRIHASTAFYGPSREFIGRFRPREEMPLWYMLSLASADYLRPEVPFASAYLPTWSAFSAARVKVFAQEASPTAALFQANEDARAQVLRDLGK